MTRMGGACLLALLCGGCAMMARREAYVDDRAAIGLAKATAAIDRSDQELYKKVGDFEQRFLKAAKWDSPNTVSPYGAFQALSVVLNGSQSDTFERLCRTLGLEDPNLERLNLAQSKVLDVLGSQPSRAMVTSSLWSVPPIKFSPRYHDDMAKWYGAEVRKTGSAGLNARGQLNDWAATKSNGDLAGLVLALSKETDSLILLNVVNLVLPLAADSVSSATVLVSQSAHEWSGTSYRAFGFKVPSSTLEVWLVEPNGDEKPGVTLARVTRQDMAAWAKGPARHMAVEVPSDSLVRRTELTSVLETLGGSSLVNGPNDFTAMSHETRTGFRISQFVQFCGVNFTKTTTKLPNWIRKLRKQPALIVRESKTGLVLAAGTWSS